MNAATESTRRGFREVGLRDGLQSVATDPPRRRGKRRLGARPPMRPGCARSRSARSYPRGCCRNSPTPRTFSRTPSPSPASSRVGPRCQSRGCRTRAPGRRRPDAGPAVREPCAQPRQPAQDAGRGRRGSGAHPRGARRGERNVIEGGVGTAFGCTLQGRVEPAEVLRLLQALLDTGADRVSLADTVGYADPRAVRTLFAQALEIAGDRFWCGHFHDTRGLGLANVAAALDVGVARFDASLAGIGGCPHAPGASGNVATEDAAFMLASMGVATGIGGGFNRSMQHTRRHCGGRSVADEAEDRAFTTRPASGRSSGSDWRKGETLHQIARLFDRYHSSIHRIRGGVRRDTPSRAAPVKVGVDADRA